MHLDSQRNRVSRISPGAIGFALLVLACGAIAQGQGKQANVYSGITGQELQYLLQELGYRAQLGEDSSGKPRIKTRLSGMNVIIYTYNCKSGRCNNIQFSVAVDLADGATLEKVNEFNKSKLFGKVFLDSNGDPVMRMTHNVALGVTAENLEYTLERYDEMIELFAKHFGFR